MVCHAVEYVVGWGLAHRTLALIQTIGVDEIQAMAKGHKYLHNAGLPNRSRGHTRLLWVGKERTLASFEGFFTLIGPTLASEIAFVCFRTCGQPYSWT